MQKSNSIPQKVRRPLETGLSNYKARKIQRKLAAMKQPITQTRIAANTTESTQSGESGRKGSRAMWRNRVYKSLAASTGEY